MASRIGQVRRPRRHLNAEVNIINLVDVMLVLLIIFMVTAPMMQGGVDVRLPRAVAQPLPARDAINVTVTRTGEIAVNGEVLAFDVFRNTFAAIVGQRASKAVYVRADDGAPYGSVARVLAVARQAGVRDVGLVMEPDNSR
ncbi:MAG: biopolymer transporter ExbD [Gemmatimonadales bacterium]|nr:biopolymer transporter ExbD [Gemmatimonadales bacterium]